MKKKGQAKVQPWSLNTSPKDQYDGPLEPFSISAKIPEELMYLTHSKNVVAIISTATQVRLTAATFFAQFSDEENDIKKELVHTLVFWYSKVLRQPLEVLKSRLTRAKTNPVKIAENDNKVGRLVTALSQAEAEVADLEKFLRQSIFELKLVKKWNTKEWSDYVSDKKVYVRSPRELLIEIALSHRYPTITEEVKLQLQALDVRDNSAMKSFPNLDFRVMGSGILEGLELTKDIGASAMHFICTHSVHPQQTATGLLDTSMKWVVGSTVSKWENFNWAQTLFETIRKSEIGADYMEKMRKALDRYILVDDIVAHENEAQLGHQSMLKVRP